VLVLGERDDFFVSEFELLLEFEDDDRIVTVVVVVSIADPVYGLHHGGFDIQAEHLVVLVQRASEAVDSVLTVDLFEAHIDE